MPKQRGSDEAPTSGQKKKKVVPKTAQGKGKAAAEPEEDEPIPNEGFLWFVRKLLSLPIIVVQALILSFFCLSAYRLRMRSADEYGYVIHEFDPWFNYRATEYLAANGAERFFKWYDYMSWYPIGRPIGTTIYPGMQFVSVWIWEALKAVPTKIKTLPIGVPGFLSPALPGYGELLFGPMSLNDVCVVVPAWFGAAATFFTFLLSLELSGSVNVGLCSAGIMSIIPAHIMRSMAGEFDNEAVAVTTFVAMLWLWCLSLRSSWHWPVGVLTGLMYGCAAATWGGYIFLNNLVALHAALLVFLGKYNSSLHKAYSLQWLIGTAFAMQVPVIGTTPLRAVEQMPSLIGFVGLQVMEVCDIYRSYQPDLKPAMKYFWFRIKVFGALAALGLTVILVLVQAGSFMPLGARIRGLFLETTKTGNPLVDSVAEHQPSNSEAYDTFLGSARHLAVLGMLLCWHQTSPAKFLAPVYAVVSYHYSLKMSRLMIICGPIVSVLAGYLPGFLLDWCMEQVLSIVVAHRERRPASTAPERTGGMGSFWRWFLQMLEPILVPEELESVAASKRAFAKSNPTLNRAIRLGVAALIVIVGGLSFIGPVAGFIHHAYIMADHMASPQLIFKTKVRGQVLFVDDYLKGYEWLRDNTPADSRVMAWWDYGYQITGVANRTSIADGNTWNHEHIATLGKIMTSSEKRAHNAMRHLADYALVWAGGAGGDDMAKSPHLARIGNSVFPDHCGDADPLCHKFSINRDGTPTPMMAQSFLYKAVMHEQEKGVKLNPKLFQEVFTSTYGLMRIYKVLNVSKESKAWIDDPANRVCDAPGSWYCVGQYPPELKPLIEKRRNFAQLEDFNRQGEKSAYTRHIEQQRGRSSQSDL